jgi:hypothetical protein
MEEVTATVQQTADHAQRAALIASQNADVAERGGAVMQRMVQTMDGIQAASTRIGDIIGVIDSIAFQTNILALNAAVEAARAGDQGRGFAVVASEVRALAGRSAKAAGEIKSLIQSSTEQVSSGNGIAREAGEAISATVDSARVVQQLLTEIDTGTREQSPGHAAARRSGAGDGPLGAAELGPGGRDRRRRRRAARHRLCAGRTGVALSPAGDGVAGFISLRPPSATLQRVDESFPVVIEQGADA